MGREDKQQHDKGADVSGDCRGYGGTMEPICNIDLDDLDTLHALDELESLKDRHDLTERSNLERLHVLDDLTKLDSEKKSRSNRPDSYIPYNIDMYLITPPLVLYSIHSKRADFSPASKNDYIGGCQNDRQQNH